MNNGVLIIGVDGLIGSRLAEMASKNNLPWTGTSRKPGPSREHIIQFDLLHDEEIHRFPIRAKISYLCAAETNLRKCESEPVETRKLNVGQTLKLARHLRDLGSEIVFLSSSLVFDGNRAFVPPDAPHSPKTEYGRQKAEVEKILRTEFHQSAIVRVTKVVHGSFPLFRDWLHAMKQGRVIQPFSDMLFTPVDLALVAEELWTLTHAFRSGIFQLSGDSELSYADAAYLLAECHGISAEFVQPRTTAQAQFPPYFPKHTTLVHTPLSGGNEPHSSRGTLERVFSAIA